MIAKRVIFKGRVQGVGFRSVVLDLARSFEVCGWVKNLPDGRVEMEIMGEPGEVEAFIKEIAEESNVAHHVRSMMVEAIPLLTGVVGFRVIW